MGLTMTACTSPHATPEPPSISVPMQQGPITCLNPWLPMMTTQSRLCSAHVVVTKSHSYTDVGLGTGDVGVCGREMVLLLMTCPLPTWTTLFCTRFVLASLPRHTTPRHCKPGSACVSFACACAMEQQGRDTQSTPRDVSLVDLAPDAP